MAVIEFGNFLWNGKDRRCFKAVATLISGYRLFFWSEKSGYANHWHIHKKNINWYIIFAGVVRGGECWSRNCFFK